MARQARDPRSSGFSLVELLVALVFTGLLMGGMAQVFKSSLGAMATSGEVLSAARRNRASIDLLYEDLNSTGMFLTDLSTPPLNVVASNPAFYILPNQPVVGAGPDGPAKADQLFFYFDQPLPFEGTLGSTAGVKTSPDLVALAAASTEADQTFTIECGDASYANLVKAGMSFIFKDSWESRFIQSASATGSQVTVIAGAQPNAAVSGLGSAGTPGKVKHIPGSGILFFQSAQTVRYSIKVKVLDPQQPAGIPCLVRDQGTYNPAGFTADPAQESIVTENVSGFKVYLSANAGQSWAGYGGTYSGFSSGWLNGIRAELDTQLVTSGRQDYKTTQGDENWFRQVPVLVRLDLTTRTASKREEYSPTPATAAYRDVVQSLVLVPRHFGLALK